MCCSSLKKYTGSRSRNSHLTLNACTCRGPVPHSAERAQSSVSGKACRAACKVLTQIASGREGEDRTDDKEEDEASGRRKGRNFRGGTAVAKRDAHQARSARSR